MNEAKKLIVCADGTWNDEDGAGGPTNVVKIHRSESMFSPFGPTSPIFPEMIVCVSRSWHDSGH
jgi:hypothetical protein